MSSSLKTCPHCQGLYERRVAGTECPHCGMAVKITRGQIEKVCPACFEKFYKAASCNGQPQCPKCGIAIYVTRKNGKVEVRRMSHKNAAPGLVEKLEQHISKRDETNFKFLPADKWAQLRHAYGILDSAETFVRAQESKIIQPVELADKAVDNALNNGYAAANSLLYLRNGMTKHFNGVWRGEVVLHKVNENNKAVNMSAYRVKA
jgi:hypothetical protein